MHEGIWDGIMVYLLGLCIFGFVLYKFPPMRKVALVIGGLIALLVVGVISYEYEQDAATKSLIPAAKLDLSNLVLSKEFSSYRLNGEVRNNSPHELTGLTLAITAYDCPGPTVTAQCVAVGEDKNVSVYADVPTGQVRAINGAFVDFSNMPLIRGQFVWSYAIAETRGMN